jgi:pimeloyl-ACP methyl ester carboxylesterase
MTTSTLQRVTSKDGTSIAFDRLGDGPPIVLVCGGSTDRMANSGLAAQLASDFSVYNFDRRGRGDSGDTQPYAVEREVEDIAAVIDAAGGRAALYGTSSGAALALTAAAALGDKVSKLLLWEPPYFVDPAMRPPLDSVAQYEQRIAEGRRGDAVEYFMTQVVRMPADFAAFARTQPWWAGQEKIAHTLAYDGRCMEDYLLPTKRAEAVTTPTLVIAGSASFPALPESAEALAKLLPNGQFRLLEGQEHNVSPDVLAPVMKAFLDA